MSWRAGSRRGRKPARLKPSSSPSQIFAKFRDSLKFNCDIWFRSHKGPVNPCEHPQPAVGRWKWVVTFHKWNTQAMLQIFCIIFRHFCPGALAGETEIPTENPNQARKSEMPNGSWTTLHTHTHTHTHSGLLMTHHQQPSARTLGAVCHIHGAETLWHLDYTRATVATLARSCDMPRNGGGISI
jgi:hypothetical protein